MASKTVIRSIQSATIYSTAFNPCKDYKVLNTSNRHVGFTGQVPIKCDHRSLIEGWYRFTGAAGDRMATTCPNIRRCGTNVPGWMSGSHPSVANGEVTRKVCYHWSNNCCQWSNNIKVKNCGGFYVYKLQKTPLCSLRYCGENELLVTKIRNVLRHFRSAVW